MARRSVRGNHVTYPPHLPRYIDPDMAGPLEQLYSMISDFLHRKWGLCGCFLPVTHKRELIFRWGMVSCYTTFTHVAHNCAIMAVNMGMRSRVCRDMLVALRSIGGARHCAGARYCKAWGVTRSDKKITSTE
ncbi:Protein of unknown function [Pyronema omphalodes CBS 100304]|uniref:Uncharacterized protein n=1 Tax=Pyronema omphalodes (strain CBS 100304) TaxID=1076935 RepID=U4L5S5_PYROM|nr:Protein of unknown function [Pyronema omphalodes CBS 100304]